MCKFFFHVNVSLVGIKSELERKQQRKHSPYGVREKTKREKCKMKTSRTKHINYEMKGSKLQSPVKLVKYVHSVLCLTWSNCCCFTTCQFRVIPRKCFPGVKL